MSHISSSGSSGSFPPGILVLNYTLVTFADSPYTVAADDAIIGVDSSGGAITINLPSTPSVARAFSVKDVSGDASSNNITIKDLANVDTIDGAANFVMNTDYQAASMFYAGNNEYFIY